ncbi:MAG TPA: hypothetical protein VFH95_08680 [Candidatus Kapabacteria bacterium]|nr:hypothetical protein [Candidatus Kapabacteria bacterium]
MKIKYKVGDTVRFQLVDKEVEGEIVEERGPIGRNGQMVYRVAVDFKYAEEPMYYNLEESSIEPAHVVSH